MPHAPCCHTPEWTRLRRGWSASAQGFPTEALTVGELEVELELLDVLAGDGAQLIAGSQLRRHGLGNRARIPGFALAGHVFETQHGDSAPLWCGQQTPDGALVRLG